MPAKSSQRSARIPHSSGPTCRQHCASSIYGTKPILPRRRKRELVSPQRRPSASRRSSDHGFHRTPFGPGCSRSSAVPSPGVASWAQRHLRINSTPSVVRRRTTGRRARILRIRVRRGHLTPVPLPSSLARSNFNNLPHASRNRCRSCPISDSLAFRTYGSENRLTSGTVNPMVKIRRLVWRGWAQIGETQVQTRGGRGNRARRSPSS
jgi:hypothetical protein